MSRWDDFYEERSYGRRDENWHDAAQVCINGHIITELAESHPDYKRNFCQECGKKTITNCPQCNEKIIGYHHITGVIHRGSSTPPSFCPSCGKPYPWTKSKINALKELVKELDEISEDEKKILSDVDELIVETPKTELVSTRFKKILRKISPESQEMIKKIGINLVCEAAKNLIWGTR